MVRAFYGPCRKLSALPILLFVAGWGIYLIGFIKRMAKPSLLLARWDNYPAIVAVGVGPVWVLAAVLQACLGGGAGAAMGSVTAVAAVVFVVALGNSSVTSAETLYQYNRSLALYNTTSESLALFYVSSTLVGSILCCLGVTLLLSLWSCYQDPPTDEEERALLFDTGAGNARGYSCRWLFPGYARKMAVPCVLLAFAGWCILVGGHHHRINSAPEEGRYFNNVLVLDFGQWGACVLTPILLIFALIHAALSGNVGVVMGVVNAVLSGIVLTSIGYYMLHDVGQWLKNECKNKCDYTIPQNAAVLCELLGSFVVCFFWSSVLGLWPFYTKSLTGETAGVLMPMSRGRTNSRDYQDVDDEEAIKL